VLLVTDVTALTMDVDRRIIRDAAIAIEGRRIVEVGCWMHPRRHFLQSAGIG